ncbi:hypothetical protein ACYSNO_11140 [Enterococcus sp. LJL98]
MKRIFIFFSLFLAFILANIAFPTDVANASGTVGGQTGFYGKYEQPNKLPPTGGGTNKKPSGRLPQTGDHNSSRYQNAGVILLSSTFLFIVYTKRNKGELQI